MQQEEEDKNKGTESDGVKTRSFAGLIYIIVDSEPREAQSRFLSGLRVRGTLDHQDGSRFTRLPILDVGK